MEEEQEQGMLVPLRMLRHTNTDHRRTDHHSDNSQLAIVDTPVPTSTAITTVSPRFKLPPGWRVRQVIRASGDRVDRYYVEQGTGYQLRSKKEVERYMKGEPVRSPRSSRAYRLDYHVKRRGSRKMIISGGKLFSLAEEESSKRRLAIMAPTSAVATSRFNLPDGWVVEEVPRRLGNYIDKYYYEPGTNRKFRSLVAVEKHLAELNENSPLSLVVAELRENNAPLSKVFKISSRVKNRGSSKSSIPKNTDQDVSFLAPPSKVNWVISSSKGDSWNAFMGDTMVPETIKQQWEKRFMLAMNENQHIASNSSFAVDDEERRECLV